MTNKNAKAEKLTVKGRNGKERKMLYAGVTPYRIKVMATDELILAIVNEGVYDSKVTAGGVFRGFIRGRFFLYWVEDGSVWLQDWYSLENPVGVCVPGVVENQTAWQALSSRLW